MILLLEKLDYLWIAMTEFYEVIFMSPCTPRLTAKQVIKQLKNAGFIEINQTGSHLKLFNKETRRTAIVPIL